jgi:hypothetical protein
MIIKKNYLPRRTILKGMGAAVALPFLDAMVPAFARTATSAANPKTNFMFIYYPHGAHRAEWIPKNEGANFEYSRILKPLEPLRDTVTVVSGLDLAAITVTGHFISNAMYLNGVIPPGTSEIRSAKTVDQILVERFGQETALPSLEVCTEDIAAAGGQCEGAFPCVFANTISWRDATTPLPMEMDPKVIFSRMFGESDGDSKTDRLNRLNNNKSILDAVTDGVNDLRPKLGQPDQGRLDDYLQSVREIERRVQRSASAGDGLKIPDAPNGVPDSFPEHVALMFDLQMLAYQGNITRVSSFMLARELSEQTYPQIGVPDGHHSVSHNGEMPDMVEKYVRINTYHHQLFADFLTKMKSTPDGDGNLLDHSMILFGSGMGNSNLHAHEKIPIVVAGGASGRHKGNNHIAAKPGTPLSNLLAGFLDTAGVPTEKLGDNTGWVEL